MNKVRTAWWVIGCVAAATLGACHSAPTRLYGIDPAAPATRIDGYQAFSLRVDNVNIPASWDRIEILSASAAGELRISEFDHWSAPLPQIVRQTLSDDLDRRLPAGSVVYPRLPKPAGALGIDVDILEFTVDASQASMRASWLIAGAAGSQGAKRSAASLQASLTSSGSAGVARVWSALIGQLADRIAADAASIQIP